MLILQAFFSLVIKLNIFVSRYFPMKIYYTTAFFLFCFLTGFTQDYRVQLNAPQYSKGNAYLIYYYGKNMNLVDSAGVNSSGEAVFSNEKTLHPGIYAVVLPGKRITFDFLVGEEQTIQILIKDTANPVESAIVSGSRENILFRDYQRFVAEKGAALEAERKAFAQAKTSADSTKHQENYTRLNRELNSYRDNIIEQYPQSMLAALLKTLKEPRVPHPAPKSRQDTLENFRHYKENYWEGVTFNDHRIIRTPFFIPKLERYFRQVIDQDPDTIIREADYLLLLARSNEPMYQFLMNWFTDEYYQPKVMGQDKVFVHLFEKYHSKGVSTWLNEKQHKSIAERAYMVMSNLIGEPAAPLVMTDVAGKESRLYDIQSKFTVVSFWDPNCGHCRTEMPLLDSLYRNKWKKEGVKIYAVLTDKNVRDKWKDFITKHNLNEWTHVYQSEAQQKAINDSGSPSYLQLYDVIQTPTVYLLDEEKRIIAKKLTLEQMDEIINARLSGQQQK